MRKALVASDLGQAWEGLWAFLVVVRPSLLGRNAFGLMCPLC